VEFEEFDEFEEFKEIINLNFLQKICQEFEYESKKTLFGLDFLYNKDTNNYTVVDCNNFPGYKELKGDFRIYLKKHIINYYKKYLEETK